MNWYKQSQQEIVEGYEALAEQVSSIQIIGSGQGESLSFPGSGQTIIARDLLEKVKQYLAPVLISNGVRVIDTSPISNAAAQGLAVSHEPGIIHVDVSKLFNMARNGLPPTSQLDGAEVDPDIINSIVAQVSGWIGGELVETCSHEARHVRDFQEAYQSGADFSTVQESPAEQFGQRMRNQYGDM